MPAKRRKTPDTDRIRLNAMILVGMALMGLWGLHKLLYIRSIRLSDTLISSYTRTFAFVGKPRTISIPGLPTLSVVEAGKINGTWTISPTFANHVARSASPGEPGNIIIYGHNTKNVFGLLKTVTPGSEITVTSDDGKIHTYRITEILTVNPDRTDVLLPTATETLTIYTCTGWLDSKRLVVRAIPT